MPKSVTTADNTTDENSADHLVMAGADVLLATVHGTRSGTKRRHSDERTFKNGRRMARAEPAIGTQRQGGARCSTL